MEIVKEDKKRLSPYYLVEFINRGRKPAIKKIDVVVGSWLFVNVKTKNASSKFPEEPYDKLQLYLENQLPAPSSWPSYTVRIRGRADTLTEAFAKLRELMRDGETVLTVSSGESATEVEKKEVEKIRQTQFIEQANKFKKDIMDSSHTPQTSSKVCKENPLQKERLSSNRLSAQRQVTTDISRPSDDELPSNKDYSFVDSEPFNKDESFEGLEAFNDEPLVNLETPNKEDWSKDSDTEVEVEETFVAHDRKKKLYAIQNQSLDDNSNDENDAQTSFTFTQMPGLQTYKRSRAKTDDKSASDEKNKNERVTQCSSSMQPENSNAQKRKPSLPLADVINTKKMKYTAQKQLSKYEEVVIDYLMYLSECQIELKALVRSNSEEIAAIKTLLLQKEVDENAIANRKQLANKYSYAIPFSTVQSFMEFDQELSNPKSSLYSDVKTVLLSGLDSSLVTSKCMVNMLKMFISKEVAMQYTAVKSVKDKNVMSTTNFYSCIEELIKERRIASNLTVTEKEFKTALSNVLTNASGWKAPDGKKPSKGLKSLKPRTTKTLETATSDSHTLNLTNEELLGVYQVLPIMSDDDAVEFDAGLNE